MIITGLLIMIIGVLVSVGTLVTDPPPDLRVG
ncbi:hypothetical protein JOE57_000811 [Microlunatus panaciterrae]|uniref:Uncharacterized protein n=1 Tax=Microlunatus panaciterrae TaxID=400768 RepID=A0ABS2RFW1_9ACTN|nr:hypothetical protein [Microlunatus panaciterrae]